MKTRLQAIFFDYDGVIIDSNETKAEAFRTLFRDYGESIVDRVVDHHRQNGGISRVEKIRYAHARIIGRPLSDDQLARWAGRFSELVVEKVIRVDWVAGARDFLEQVRGSRPVFVISGTPEEELRYIIERRGTTGYFDAICGSPVTKPEHVRRLLGEHRLDPGACVFVGDALTDCNAARQTGLYFIGIRGPLPFPEGTPVLPDCRRLGQAIEARFDW